MSKLKITFLGTGTSNGIPLIACDCPVCTSKNPKNNRLRCSLLLEKEGETLLIDASSDFRQQALRANIRKIENILITHIHADHIFGLDDVRRYNWLYKKPVNIYLKQQFDAEIREVFKYIYYPTLQLGGGIPQINNNVIEHGKMFKIEKFEIIPLNIMHGLLPIFGFRIDNIAYLTDCSKIPEDSYKYLKNLDILVLDALRYREHPTHFSIDEAVAEAQKIGAKKTFFIHIAHDLEHEETNKKLPANMQLAYDGLVLEV